MSYDTLRRRRLVTITNVSTGEDVDQYGNVIRIDGDPITTYAQRQQLSSAEDIVDRDQQARTFRYFFRADVVINGRSKINDSGQELRIVGEPEVIYSNRNVHHIEAVAELIEG